MSFVVKIYLFGGNFYRNTLVVVEASLDCVSDTGVQIILRINYFFRYIYHCTPQQGYTLNNFAPPLTTTLILSNISMRRLKVSYLDINKYRK